MTPALGVLLLALGARALLAPGADGPGEDAPDSVGTPGLLRAEGGAATATVRLEDGTFMARASPSPSYLSGEMPEELLAALREEAEDFPFELRTEQLRVVSQRRLRDLSAVNMSHERDALAPLPMLWEHIHKAGGTFMCAMAQAAGENVVFPNTNCNYNGDGSQDLYKSSGAKGRHWSCKDRDRIFGPCTWGQVEHELWNTDICHRHFRYGTMLRNPLALIQSMMNFHPKIGHGFYNKLMEALKASRTGAEQWAEGSWKMLDNFMIRTLGNFMKVPAGKIGEKHLNRVLRRLNKFDVVARLEDLSADHPLFRELGWPDHVRGAVGDKKNHHYNDINLTPEERATLEDLNKYDMKLWESFPLEKAQPKK